MEYKSGGAASEVDLAVLFDDLVRFETQLWDVVDAELRAAHDLPLTWFEPMGVVRRTPDCRVMDVAEASSITVGGASKLVDRICAARLALRTPHPDDGRSSIIALTDAGRQLLEAAESTFRNTLGERLGGVLAPQTLAQFAATIATLRRSLRDETGSS